MSRPGNGESWDRGNAAEKEDGGERGAGRTVGGVGSGGRQVDAPEIARAGPAAAAPPAPDCLSGLSGLKQCPQG